MEAETNGLEIRYGSAQDQPQAINRILKGLDRLIWFMPHWRGDYEEFWQVCYTLPTADELRRMLEDEFAYMHETSDGDQAAWDDNSILTSALTVWITERWRSVMPKDDEEALYVYFTPMFGERYEQ